MSMDQALSWLNSHPKPVAGACLVLAAAALVAVLWPGETPETAIAYHRAYFYDTVDRRIFVDWADQVPPFNNSDGHECVSALFFTCGECGESDRFLGYYMKYTPAYREKVLAKSSDILMTTPGTVGALYSQDGQTWSEANSPQGQKIAQAKYSRCPSARPCVPEPE